MDRGRKALPVQNKACNQRYIKRCQERHRQKLRDMKCSIDNKPPRQATHLRTKAKKNALMEDRIDQIEMENRILLEKMTNIMKVNKGGIDNKNESTKYGKSLSKERRKRELQKITKQNHKILKRIQGARPTYNHKAWEVEARANDRILTNICEFKPKFSLMNKEKMGGTAGGGGGHHHDLYDEDYLMDFDYESVGTAEE